MLIALVGFIGSGKDTLGRYLVEYHGYHDLAFADSLKEALCAIFGWPREMIDGKTPQSRAWRDQIDPWWAARLGIPNFTPRWALQNVGTECLRRHFHDDLFILRVEREIEVLRGEDRRVDVLDKIRTKIGLGSKDTREVETKIVITDGRFPNELDMVRAKGGKIVRVRRGPEPEWFSTAEAANSDTFLHAPECAFAMEESGVHISEWAWVGYKFDAIIDNSGSIDDLFRQADNIL